MFTFCCQRIDDMVNMPTNHPCLHPSGHAPNAARSIGLVVRELNASSTLVAGQYAWGQVAYTHKSVIRVNAGKNFWIVPPQRAIWIPPQTNHEIAVLERARLRVLNVYAGVSSLDVNECAVLEVSSLLLELSFALEQVEADDARESMLADLILN